ncbi:MAG: succinylglutamate desuccinylase/aspartoacylase family protein [Magnetovibrio sp.]|nr:succinylglutamate desuccinylase/aspartoacylase family protein [Magnetovibrio sp.]
MTKSTRDQFEIGEAVVAAGDRTTVDLPIMHLSTHTPVDMPVHVIHGRQEGPVLFVCAALHGDEINGVEIIRRLLQLSILKNMRGTLLAIPVVNVFGFLAQSRYLPDRRDLNRSFPSSEQGSMAGRLADFFLSEIVAKATHGIDLHTGAIHRTNFPQVRADLDDVETVALARSFGVPVIINAGLREGSLRAAAGKFGIPILVYEAGEALRYDEMSIRAGVNGVIRTMRHLGMLPKLRSSSSKVDPVTVRSSRWERAPISGVMRALMEPGTAVRRGDLLGVISDPFGAHEVEVRSRFDGIIIGGATLPVVNEGDALFHVGLSEGTKASADALDAFEPDDDYDSGATAEIADEPPVV